MERTLALSCISSPEFTFLCNLSLIVTNDRSGGQRGASVVQLRGTSGADFEATGRIRRTSEGIGCGCFGATLDHSDMLLLIKGPFIFVFASETSSSPKYAISLKQLQAKSKNTEHGRHPVVLETALGDAQYEVSFEQADVAEKFVAAVKKQSASAERADIKKRLGHEHLLSKRASTKFAEQIANEKCKDAPPKVGMNADPNELNVLAGATM
jgi:hypothetical protein